MTGMAFVLAPGRSPPGPLNSLGAAVGVSCSPGRPCTGVAEEGMLEVQLQATNSVLCLLSENPRPLNMSPGEH